MRLGIVKCENVVFDLPLRSPFVIFVPAKPIGIHRMILQRVQALYFLAAALLAAGSVLWGFSPRWVADNSLAEVLIWISAAVSLVTIFLFKHLALQHVLARMVILINAIVFVIFVLRGLNLSGGVSSPEKGIETWGLLLLFASTVAALCASRAVKKDLRIVKSADRLR